MVYTIYTTEMAGSVIEQECESGVKYDTILNYFLCDQRIVPRYAFRDWINTYRLKEKCRLTRRALVHCEADEEETVLLSGRLLRAHVCAVYSGGHGGA